MLIEASKASTKAAPRLLRGKKTGGTGKGGGFKRFYVVFLMFFKCFLCVFCLGFQDLNVFNRFYVVFGVFFAWFFKKPTY